MGKTESIFAAILLGAVALAVVVVLARSGGNPPTGDDPYAEDVRPGSAFVTFTGNEKTDICTCYEQAYAYGRTAGNTARSLEGVEYRGGFAACSQRLGSEGGNAWSWGWANGAQGTGTPRTCEGYLSQIRADQGY